MHLETGNRRTGEIVDMQTVETMKAAEAVEAVETVKTVKTVETVETVETVNQWKSHQHSAVRVSERSESRVAKRSESRVAKRSDSRCKTTRFAAKTKLAARDIWLMVLMLPSLDWISGAD